MTTVPEVVRPSKVHRVKMKDSYPSEASLTLKRSFSVYPLMSMVNVHITEHGCFCLRKEVEEENQLFDRTMGSPVPGMQWLQFDILVVSIDH